MHYNSIYSITQNEGQRGIFAEKTKMPSRVGKAGEGVTPRSVSYTHLVTGYIKLQIEAGKATPAPPVGPALGQKGVNTVSYTHLEATSAQMADGSWEELPGNMPCVISPDRADHGMIPVSYTHLDVYKRQGSI